MPRAGERTYACSTHGAFDAWVDAEHDLDAVWQQPCPVCGASSDLRQPRSTGIELGRPPAGHGDIQRPYYSTNLGRWVGSKRDLRDGYAALGMQPLSDADLKHCCERVDSADRQCKRERAEIAADTTDGLLTEVEACAAEPEGEAVLNALPIPERSLSQSSQSS